MGVRSGTVDAHQTEVPGDQGRSRATSEENISVSSGKVSLRI